MFLKMLLVMRMTHVTPCTLPYSQLPAFTASYELQKSETRKQDGR